MDDIKITNFKNMVSDKLSKIRAEIGNLSNINKFFSGGGIDIEFLINNFSLIEGIFSEAEKSEIKFIIESIKSCTLFGISASDSVDLIDGARSTISMVSVRLKDLIDTYNIRVSENTESYEKILNFINEFITSGYITDVSGFVQCMDDIDIPLKAKVEIIGLVNSANLKHYKGLVNFVDADSNDMVLTDTEAEIIEEDLLTDEEKKIVSDARAIIEDFTDGNKEKEEELQNFSAAYDGVEFDPEYEIEFTRNLCLFKIYGLLKNIEIGVYDESDIKALDSIIDTYYDTFTLTPPGPTSETPKYTLRYLLDENGNEYIKEDLEDLDRANKGIVSRFYNVVNERLASGTSFNQLKPVRGCNGAYYVVYNLNPRIFITFALHNDNIVISSASTDLTEACSLCIKRFGGNVEKFNPETGGMGGKK